MIPLIDLSEWGGSYVASMELNMIRMFFTKSHIGQQKQILKSTPNVTRNTTGKPMKGIQQWNTTGKW